MSLIHWVQLVPLWVGWSLMRAFLLGDGWKQGNVQQTVLGKYPVVAITNAEVVISVAQAVEFQGGAELLLHLIGQLGVVEGDVVL